MARMVRNGAKAPLKALQNNDPAILTGVQARLNSKRKAVATPLKTLQQSFNDSSILVGSPSRVNIKCKAAGKGDIPYASSGNTKAVDKENVKVQDEDKKNILKTKTKRGKVAGVPLLITNVKTRSQLSRLNQIPKDSRSSASSTQSPILPFLLPKTKKGNADICETPKPTSSMQTTFFSDSNNESTVVESPNTQIEKPPKKLKKAYELMVYEAVPKDYWKELAIQRQKALEEVLRENELLRDNLQVLETENQILNTTVKELEMLAELVKGMMDE